MFIAMNRFKVLKGEEKAFEEVWLSRDTRLGEVTGFVEFTFIARPRARGPYALFLTHDLDQPGAVHRLDPVRAIPRRA